MVKVFETVPLLQVETASRQSGIFGTLEKSVHSQQERRDSPGIRRAFQSETIRRVQAQLIRDIAST